MAYTALYRKYRPSNFNSVVGQDTIVGLLKKSVINNKISHAYLFCGPRGTGKTSVAKIFAHAVNCVNFKDDICGECEICKLLTTNDSDIIEIDAASNNGVDEIRLLRENVKLLPSFCKYKIYIIDEVHMLSNGAFNALLKTLEEPPSHVIFILATTEPNKIPLTILSRCQRFDFNRIDNKSIEDRLLFICEKENKTIDKSVLEKIALNSDGGLRDAINLLDQVCSFDEQNINVESIDELSGKISKQKITELFKILIHSNYKEMLDYSENISYKHFNYRDIVDTMLIVLRDYVVKNEISGYFEKNYLDILNSIEINVAEVLNITRLINDLSKELKNSNNQKVLFEIYMIKIMTVLNESNNKITENIKVLEDKMVEEVINNNSNEVIEEDEKEQVAEIEISASSELNDLNIDLKKIRINNLFVNANKNELQFVNNNFDNINDFISNKKYNNLANLLLNAHIVAASDKYLLFTFDNISDVNIFDSNYTQVENLLTEIYNKEYKVVSILDNEWIELKKEYIFNKKNNIPYVFMEENEVKLNRNTSYNDFENSALNIFGEDTISVK